MKTLLSVPFECLTLRNSRKKVLTKNYAHINKLFGKGTGKFFEFEIGMKSNNEKMIYFITGASAVGKTTLVSALKEKYNNMQWAFLHFDSIGVPSESIAMKRKWLTGSLITGCSLSYSIGA